MSAGPVLLATRNRGKLRELRHLLEGIGIPAIDLTQAALKESPEEDQLESFPTFEENAIAKASYFHARTGRPVIADDSGLVVDALGGEPGVLSKRWSGREDLSGRALDDANNAKLVAALMGLSERSARYVCVAAYVDSERTLVGRGEVRGHILANARGSLGFGYDPLFFSEELKCSFGESSVEAKEAVSHRGRAMRALVAQLRVQR